MAVPSPARRASRRATDRLDARRNLATALSTDDRQSLASLALRGRLDNLGPLEATANRNVARALEWPYLERALATDEDTAIVAAYDPGLFGDADALTPTQRERVELAHARLEWLAEVRSALRNRNLTVLREAVANAPAGADERLSDVEHARIERLTTRGAAVDRLATALRDGPDEAIIEALNDVATAGATLPEALDWAAVRGIVDRMTLGDAIRQAATADPPDYGRLARLLPVARAAAADGDPRLGPDLDIARLERDVLRAAHIARLRDALFQGDDATIAAAADPDPYNVLATLDPEQRARVNRALAARRGR
jgi:hypothetical protein